MRIGNIIGWMVLAATLLVAISSCFHLINL